MSLELGSFRSVVHAHVWRLARRVAAVISGYDVSRYVVRVNI